MKTYEDRANDYDIAEKAYQKSKRTLRQYKNARNKSFREKYKTFFMVCDIIMICCVLFNLGAVVITNMLVLKVQPNTEFEWSFSSYLPIQ